MTFTSEAAGTQAGRCGVGGGGQRRGSGGYPATPGRSFWANSFLGVVKLTQGVACEKCLALTYSVLPACLHVALLQVGASSQVSTSLQC